MNDENIYTDPIYDEKVTMSHNDRARAEQQSLEKEVIRLREQIKLKDKILKDYEETITNSSIKNISDNSNDIDMSNVCYTLTKDDLFNIMYNQSVIAIRNDSKPNE
jgi:hypothetical protein